MRIMIINENNKLNKLLVSNLEELNYQCDVVTTVKDAIFYIKIRKYQLIIDYKLIDTISNEVLKNLKINNEIYSIDKLMDIENNYKSIIDDILILLESKKIKIFKYKDLVIDQENDLIIYKDSNIRVNKLLCKLLTFLIKNKNKTFSKDELANKLFDDETTVSSAIINTVVYQIRDKIEKKFNISIIETVNYTSYKLVY